MIVWVQRLFAGPEIERLEAEMSYVRGALERQAGSPPPYPGGWAGMADKHLKHAEEQLEKGRLQRAWRETKAAERALLYDSMDGGMALARVHSLEAETDKVGGWR